MEGKFWYVLQVKFGAEKRVGKNLEKQGLKFVFLRNKKFINGVIEKNG